MKSLKLACALSCIFSSFAMNAETAHHHEKHVHDEKPIVTVVISTKRIVEESLKGKEIQKRINDEQALVTASFPAMESAIKAKDASLAQQQNNYNEKVKSLEAKSKMISEDARNKEIDELQEIRRQIEEMTAERERLIRKFNEDAKRAEQRLKTMYEKEMMGLEVEMKDAVTSAKNIHGWDIVHFREALADASERVDKTSIIISMLDAAEIKRREAKTAEAAVKKASAAVKKAA